MKLLDNVWRNKIYAATTDDPNYVFAMFVENEFVTSVKKQLQVN